MEELFIRFFNASIAASWAALAVMLLRGILRRAPRQMVCLLWLIIGFRLLCPVSIESAVSIIPSAETVPTDFAVSLTPAVTSGVAIINSTVNPILESVFVPTQSRLSLFWVTRTAWMVWLWGIAVMVLYTAVSYLRLRRQVAESIPQGGVYFCDRVKTPFILGILRPRIYLPSDISEEAADFVLRHEKTHIRRLHHVAKPIGFLLLAVNWYNPILWVSYCLFCRDIELSCDEAVIEKLTDGEKKEYSKTLLSLSVQRKSVSACPLAFGENDVKRRIKNVLSYKKPAFWVLIAALLVIAVAAVCLITDPVGTKGEAFRLLEYGTEWVSEDGELSLTVGYGGSLDAVYNNRYVKLECKDGDVTALDIWSSACPELFHGKIYGKNGKIIIKTGKSAYNEFTNRKLVFTKSKEPIAVSGVYYTWVTAFANYTDAPAVYTQCRNANTMQTDSVQHLPAFVIDSVKALENFKTQFGGVLCFDESCDEVGSFTSQTDGCDEAFFGGNYLVCVYVPDITCSNRYGVAGCTEKDKTFTVRVGYTRHPEEYDDAMCGWWVLVSVDKSVILRCDFVDAVLDTTLGGENHGKAENHTAGTEYVQGIVTSDIGGGTDTLSRGGADGQLGE